MSPPKDPVKFEEWRRRCRETTLVYFADPLNHIKASEAHKKTYANNPAAVQKNKDAQKKRFEDHPELRAYMKVQSTGRVKTDETIKRQKESIHKYYLEHPEARVAAREKMIKYYSDPANRPNHKGENNPRYGKKITEETREKLCVSHTGKMKEQSSHWMGGITPLQLQIRNSPANLEWKQKVFERDNHTCQTTFVKGGKIEAHHIIPFSKLKKEFNITTLEEALVCPALWDVSNGITLSKVEHRKLHKISKEE